MRTLRGTLTFRREVFECPRTRRQVAPLDTELGLACGAKMTREVVSKVAWAGAAASYEEASENLGRLAGLEVSKAEFARVVLEEGARVAELQQEREERWSEPVASGRPVFPPEAQCQRIVIEADATAVLAVAGEEHKMVYCARAYDADSRYEKGGREMVAGESRYAASGDSFEAFGHSLDALANRLGARSAAAIAFVADGAPCLWKMAAERLPQAVHIQDFWHVCERLFGLARCLRGQGGKDTPAARAAGERWKGMLWEGRAQDIAGELRALHAKARGERREAIRKEIGYLQEGLHRMDYPAYRAAGWPCGSGAVEATCKHLVKQRLCVTGARWRRSSIPSILALRLSRANREWDRDFTPNAAAA